MAFVPSPDVVSCVYWIRHPEHSDIFSQGYVGISKHFDRRLLEHLKKTQNRHLRFAIQKYGWDNLLKEKVLIGKEDYCLEIESKLRPSDKIGWNLVKGGNKPPVTLWNKGTKGIMKSWLKGKNIPKDVREKISISVKNLWKNKEYHAHMSSKLKGKPCPMKGKKHSPETIEKMRLAKAGKPSKRLGKPISEEARLRLMTRMQLEKWTCPHCNTSGRSIGAGNRWHFDNCKGAK